MDGKQYKQAPVTPEVEAEKIRSFKVNFLLPMLGFLIFGGSAVALIAFAIWAIRWALGFIN